MINYETERFVDLNDDEVQEEKVDDKNIVAKKRNKNQNAFNQVQALFDMNKLEQIKQKQQNLKQQQEQKDRKIKKLTQINKQLIQTLKTHNQQLSERLKHQRLKIPKIQKKQKDQHQNPATQKKIESLKKQIENAYRQIDYYKQTIQNSKSKTAPLQKVQKVKQLQSVLKIQDSNIQKYHQQIKVLQKIKQQQEKQLNAISNDQFKYNQKRQEKQISQLKQRLKVAKKNLVKRQQLQKKQHFYLVQLEKTYRKLMKQQDKEDQQIQINNAHLHSNQISELEWKQTKIKLIQAKKVYEENRRKILYINHVKSKQEKNLSQNQLKIKQKERQLKKLQTKFSQMVKLSKVREKQKTVHNLSLTKIQDLITRQNSNSLQINAHIQKLRQIGIKQKQEEEKQKNLRQMRNIKKWVAQVENTVPISNVKPSEVQKDVLNKQKQSDLKGKSKTLQRNTQKSIKQEKKLQISKNLQLKAQK